MIASLKGRLESRSADRAVINVGGVGFQVFMPTSAISVLGTAGEEVTVHTHLHVRDDNLTLFGFASPEELFLFETLITVSGLGPRLALALLSTMSAQQLTLAIATANADLITITPGVGKKVAQRIILELKEKIGAGWVITPATQMAQEDTDVLAALTSLGYSVAEAQKAVATLPADDGLGLEEKIKLALQYLGAG